MKKSVQDYYSNGSAHCYGCGKLNEDGLHIQTFWDGDETVCHFEPRHYHTAFPGFVYGGLLASLVDCHGTGTAAAFAYREAGQELGSEPEHRFVTASLKVNYLRPTPLDTTLELRGKATEIKERKIIVAIELYAKGELCVRGEVVAVRATENTFSKKA